MKTKLTHRSVNALKPSDKPYDVRDTELTGFIARVRPSGVISYLVQYRDQAGAQQSYTIGLHGKDSFNPTTARDKAESIKHEAKKGGDPHRERKESSAERKRERGNTLDAYLSGDYQEHLEQRKEHSAAEAERMIRRNFKSLLGEPLTAITTDRVRRWRRAQLKPRIINGKKRPPLANSTIRRVNAELCSLITHAVKDKYLASNPLADLEPLKAPSQRDIKPRFLSPEERLKLDAALAERQAKIAKRQKLPEDQRFCNHLEPMIILSLNTGMRRGELFSLDWSDIDDDFNQIELRAEHTKASKARTIYLNSSAKTALLDWRRQTNSTDLVFDNDGAPFTDVKKAWRLLMDQAKLKHFRWHDMRHDFASQLVIRGVPLNTVRDLLGHKDIQTTLRYAHLSDDSKSNAVALLDTD